MKRVPKTPTKSKEIIPVEFVPMTHAFEPQVEVQATRDISGWVDRGRRSGKKIKWNVRDGDIGYLDIQTARQFEAKGYVRITGGKELIKNMSDDERAEIMSEVTTIGMPNG